ncbi:MAG TPA: hypothetical protein VKT70_08580, partial [Stellaceae bacterium]|nr:hypothetical protein [Stellaceae bacterium]
MTKPLSLLATCSVAALLAASSGALAGGVRIGTAQPDGVTIAPGTTYLTITGTSVTGNVTNPQGVTLGVGALSILNS